MLLKALGYSYDEIAERTGYSWTKVNRSLTEGRRRFLERFVELSNGRRCDEFQVLLSTACDGEASPEQERTLRAHLAACGSCRAALRGYRAAPRQVAELFPPGIVTGLAQQQSWLGRLGDWVSVNSGDRAGALASKLHQSAEALGAQKAAAVVASTAALAGGTAVHEQRQRDPERAHRAGQVERVRSAQVAEAGPVPAAPLRAAPLQAGQTSPPAETEGDAAAAPAEEFAPTPAAAASPRVAVPSPPGEFGGPGQPSGGSGGGAEFGP
jgi:hypothetical protein